LLDTRSRLADIGLNPAVSWSIEVDGGVTDLEGDLRSIRLGGLDVRGGANHVRIRLGAPDGTARVALAGGASVVRFDRPRGVATAVQVRDGVSRLRFDGQEARTVGGSLRLQTDEYAAAPDRYEFELGGGASEVTIGEA
jgi:hypothetical protein